MGRLQAVILLLCERLCALHCRSFSCHFISWLRLGCAQSEERNREPTVSPGSGVILALTEFWFCSDLFLSLLEATQKSPIEVPRVAFGTGDAASYSGGRLREDHGHAAVGHGLNEADGAESKTLMNAKDKRFSSASMLASVKETQFDVRPLSARGQVEGLTWLGRTNCPRGSCFLPSYWA